jgi:hypothetical protein
VPPGLGGRKLRLFLAACCRRVWRALDEEEYRKPAIEVVERFADGLGATFGELTDVCPVRVWDCRRS